MIAVNSQTSAENPGSDQRLQSIVIIGGGAPGWLAAAALARVLQPHFCSVRVVESARDSNRGGARVALPSFHRLNALLGIDEQDMLRRTRGSFRLGAEFFDWGRLGERYFHTYGSVGARLEAVAFHHYWLKLRALGDATCFERYSTAAAAAGLGKFSPPLADRSSVLSSYSYGYHFDEDLLAAYLREFAQAHGAHGLVADIAEVPVRERDGFIDGLRLANGEMIRADLYVDCSGDANLLQHTALNLEFEDWSHWLPCNRVAALMTAGAGLAPHSQVIAHPAGWSYRTPVQGGVDQGYVYSSEFCSDQQALEFLSQSVKDGMGRSPRLTAFTPGRPKRFWDRNYLLLAVNCLDPLESTGMHLLQTGISRLLTLFPIGKFSVPDMDEYNRITGLEYSRIRDFQILHYTAGGRDDSPFWRHCSSLKMPDSLRAKVELFKSTGRVSLSEEEHFSEESWLSVYFGRGVIPAQYDPLADVLAVDHIREALAHMRALIDRGVSGLPTLGHYLERYCGAHGSG